MGGKLIKAMKLPENIIAGNLAALRPSADSVALRELAHVYDAAELLVSRTVEKGEPIGFLPENDAFIEEYRALARLIFGDGNESAEAAPEAKERGADKASVPNRYGDGTFSARRSEARQADRQADLSAVLCAAICDKLQKNGFPFTPQSFFEGAENSAKNARIAYLRNAYSDSAYRAFSSVLKNAAVTYPDDFNGVCEEVYYERCRYCILPIESSADGTLVSFRKLARKYELCPVMSCTVVTGDGSSSTEFMLFSKKIELIDCGVHTKKRLLCFRLNGCDGREVMNTLKALALFGMKLRKLESSPVSWDDERFSAEIAAEYQPESLVPLLTYLTLELPGCDVIGAYTQLQE